jgi:uncharacterized membrane protein YagU involved in acid resistance
MQTKQVIAEIGAGLIGGYVGTKVMEPVEMKLYEMEPETARKQEDAVRPGSPYEIAARKTTELLGVHLSDQQVKTVGTLFFHYGLGLSWGVLTVVFQRRTKLNPVLAGALSGTAMWILVEEGMTPALGLSAPDRAYPLATHVRAFLGHVVFGVTAASAAALVLWLGRHDAGR